MITAPPPSSAASEQPSGRRTTAWPLTVLTSLFFMWGFMTVMNDVLIPHLRSVFQLTWTESMLVQFCFFGAYFLGSLAYYLISVSKGDPIQRLGYKRGLILGLLVSAMGSALFVPATYVHVYAAYLIALFVLGLGFTLLQIAANPFVAIIGAPESASSRLNLAQGFNSLGTTLAPVIGGALIFRLYAGDAAVRWPYLFFALLLLAQAAWVRATGLPEPARTEQPPVAGAWRYPQLRWGMVAIFCYVGAEVAIGSLLIGFAQLPTIAGLTPDEAKFYTALYWGGAMIGRFGGAIALRQGRSLKERIVLVGLVGGVLLAALYLIHHAESGVPFERIRPFRYLIGANLAIALAVGARPARALGVYAGLAALLVVGAMCTEGHLALWLLTGVGLFNSILWSNIFTQAIDGLGEDTGQGSSLLVMMILGGALVPVLQGFFADGQLGLQRSFIVPVACYLYLAWYGFFGSKHGPPRPIAQHP